MLSAFYSRSLFADEARVFRPSQTSSAHFDSEAPSGCQVLPARHDIAFIIPDHGRETLRASAHSLCRQLPCPLSQTASYYKAVTHKDDFGRLQTVT